MRECLHAFEGSHSFHNYTQRRRYRPENMVSRREAKDHRCSQARLCTCVGMPDCALYCSWVLGSSVLAMPCTGYVLVLSCSVWSVVRHAVASLHVAYLSQQSLVSGVDRLEPRLFVPGPAASTHS